MKTNTEAYIINKMAEQLPDWKVTSISIMPWGAYIYAENKNNGRKRTFTINF